MKKLIPTLLSIVVAVIFTTSIASAHLATERHHGHKYMKVSVAWIKDTQNDLDKDFDKVLLSGKVVKKLNGDSYLFKDSTGTIRLDSDMDLPLHKEIYLYGSIDQAYLHIGPLEVNVHDYESAK